VNDSTPVRHGFCGRGKETPLVPRALEKLAQPSAPVPLAA
jgi:hypothetical protein